MLDTIEIAIPASEAEIEKFITNGVVYKKRTYNKEALVKMGFKAMSTNFHGYVKKYGLNLDKDIYGKSALDGEQIAKFLLKKGRTSTNEDE